jgi:hypothetical protein
MHTKIDSNRIKDDPKLLNKIKNGWTTIRCRENTKGHELTA